MPNPENIIGKGNRFRSNDEQSREWQKKGGIASGKSRRAMESARAILAAHPELTEKTLKQLQKQGIDTDKAKNTDNQTLLNMVIFQKAIQGDLDSQKFFTDLSGQDVGSKIQLERERIALERERLEIERMKLELMLKGVQAEVDSVPIIVDDVAEKLAERQGDTE